MDQQDLLLGISDQVFTRGAQGVAGLLLVTAVRYLARIAADIGELKKTVTIIVERSDGHEKRIDKLETAVFNSGKHAG